jgi:hypothetical protein
MGSWVLVRRSRLRWNSTDACLNELGVMRAALSLTLPVIALFELFLLC